MTEKVVGKIITKDDIIFKMTVNRENFVTIEAPEVPPETSIQILLNAAVQVLFASFERTRIVKL